MLGDSALGDPEDIDHSVAQVARVDDDVNVRDHVITVDEQTFHPMLSGRCARTSPVEKVLQPLGAGGRERVVLDIVAGEKFIDAGGVQRLQHALIHVGHETAVSLLRSEEHTSYTIEAAAHLRLLIFSPADETSAARLKQRIGQNPGLTR